MLRFIHNRCLNVIVVFCRRSRFPYLVVVFYVLVLFSVASLRWRLKLVSDDAHSSYFHTVFLSIVSALGSCNRFLLSCSFSIPCTPFYIFVLFSRAQLRWDSKSVPDNTGPCEWFWLSRQLLRNAFNLYFNDLHLSLSPSQDNTHQFPDGCSIGIVTSCCVFAVFIFLWWSCDAHLFVMILLCSSSCDDIAMIIFLWWSCYDHLLVMILLSSLPIVAWPSISLMPISPKFIQ